MAPRLLVRDPLVSVAGFRAHPTSLDLNNLRSGSSIPAEQDAQLRNLLIEASDTAQNTICRQPLQAHIMTGTDRGRVNRRGEVTLEALHFPVRRLLSLSYGAGARTTVTVNNPTLGTDYRIEDDQLIVVDLGGGSWSFTGSLQVGPPMGAELSLSYSYVAGYANTLLSAAPSKGATSVTVKDPTGIEPGDLLRIWEPGVEETVQVAANYTPAPSSAPAATAVPLTAALANDHTVGAHISGLPADAYEAVIHLTVDKIQRPGQGGGSSWPGAKAKSATAKQTPASAIYQRAVNLLRPYTARR